MRVADEQPLTDEDWSALLRPLLESEVLFREFRDAREVYPQITNAFGLLIGYISHLQKKCTSQGSGETLALPDGFELPPWLGPLIIRCVNGDRQACQLLGGEDTKVDASLSCEHLFAQYQLARQRELEELIAAMRSGSARLATSSGSGLNILAAQRDSEYLWNLLKKHRCIT